jgi:hypothetical protein
MNICKPKEDIKRRFSYNYHNSGPCLLFKTQCFGDWILSPSSVSGDSSIYVYLAQLSRFHLKTETEFSLQNVVLKMKHRTMDNVQNCGSYTGAAS